jgi:hypothetical protein
MGLKLKICTTVKKNNMRFLKWHFSKWPPYVIHFFSIIIPVCLYASGYYESFGLAWPVALGLNVFLVVGNLIYFKRNNL